MIPDSLPMVKANLWILAPIVLRNPDGSAVAKHLMLLLGKSKHASGPIHRTIRDIAAKMGLPDPIVAQRGPRGTSYTLLPEFVKAWDRAEAAKRSGNADVLGLQSPAAEE